MKNRTNLLHIWKASWIDHYYFDLPLWGRAVLLGFLAALLGFILDEGAHAFGYPWFYERLLENGVEGVAIGLVVFWFEPLA